MQDYPTRKRHRLQHYDYGSNGAYHVILSTNPRRAWFGTIVGQADLCLPQIKLNTYGQLADRFIRSIHNVYSSVHVDTYCIMPDHIHLLLRIENGAQESARPTVSTVVRSLKIMMHKHIGQRIFQNSYYDHIIRCRQDYDETWTYIENNPIKAYYKRR